MKHKRIWQAVATALGALLGVVGAGLIAASVSGQNLTQGYVSEQPVQNGMMVRLDPKDASKVQILTIKDMNDMLGVVVSATDSPLAVSNPSEKQVFVATYGKFNTLVSNENGVIKAGDFITISSVDGVGMRADGNYQLILGKALLGFAGGNDAESHTTLKDSLGGTRDIALRRIPVEISVAHNPLFTGDSIAGVPHFLASIAKNVSKKPVTALRIYACLGVMLLAFMVAGWVMYSGVRTGMNAVGRNPLARKSILRNLITVILMSLIVVAIGLIAVYLLLKI